MEKFQNYDIKSIDRKKYIISIIFILLLSFLIRLNYLNLPLLNSHYFRQTQTATVARNFYLYGIDPLHPRLDIFGSGKEKILLIEFPFYQIIVSFFAYIIGYYDWLGRSVSLLMGILSGIVLLLLVQELTGSRLISLFSMLFFLFMPLNIFYQQAFMIESTVVFLHILSIYSWFKFISLKSFGWYFISIIVTTLALLQKSVYAPILIPVILTLFFVKFKKVKKHIAYCVVGFLIPILVFILWQNYVDHTNLTNGNLIFTSGSAYQWSWNFGSLSERLSYSAWVLRINNIIQSISKFSLFAFLIGLYALLFIRKNKILISWLFFAILFLVLFWRVQLQVYYLMIILPIVAVISGYGIQLSVFILSKVSQKTTLSQFIPITFIIVFFIAFSVKSWQDAQPYFLIDTNMNKDLSLLKKLMTQKGDVVFVLEQKDWNSVYTYYTYRIGIVATPSELNFYKIKNLKDSGYRYLVLFKLPSYSLSDSLVSDLNNNLTQIYNKDHLLVYQF